MACAPAVASLVARPNKFVVVKLHMMYDSIVHLLGNTMSDRTVYTVTGFMTRAPSEITAKVSPDDTLLCRMPPQSAQMYARL